MKALTGRQREFLGRLLDLYQREAAPVHYSIIADRLGVGNVTAYEMMRLLEERGLVQSEYQRPEDMRGPGRSSVVFRPTPLAMKVILRLANGRWSEREWEQARTRILDQLNSGKAADYETLLDELLKRLPHEHSPTAFLAQMLAAIVLGLRSLKGVADLTDIRNAIRKVGLPGELDLSALAGLTVGFSLVERLNRRFGSAFAVLAKKYQRVLAGLNLEDRGRLAEFTREILDIVGI